MQYLRPLYRHPLVAPLLSALLVVSVQLATTWLSAKVDAKGIFGLPAVTNAVSPIPTFGGDAINLAVTVIAGSALLVLGSNALGGARIGFGLIAGGAIANAVQLDLTGSVVDWIPLPYLAMLSPGDVALALGIALIVALYFSDSDALPWRLSRKDVAVIGAGWGGLSLWSGARHHLVAAAAGLSLFGLAWLSHIVAKRMRTSGTPTSSEC